MAHHKRKRRLQKVVGMVTFALTASILTGSAVHGVQAAGNGKTEVNLGVTELTEENVSFEVPLYYVLCVTEDEDGKAKVILPGDAYSIVNTSTIDQGAAVTQVSVTGVTGGTWSLVDSDADLGTSATDQKIFMTVGGITLPALAAGSTAVQSVETNASENSFYAAGKYIRMESYDKNAPAKSTVVIPVTAKVPETYQVTANKKPVAQFRLSYTVSPLNKNGDVMKAKVVQ